MKKYEVLEHPAELRLRVYGKTLEELFKNAVLAMARILSRRGGTKSELKVKNSKCKIELLKIESLDINSLLVDFLSEILARSQINKCVYYVSSSKIQDSRLEAELVALPRERFKEDIKAVTYEDLDIKKINDTYQTDLVFDI
jgi:SHS2 domain-containing protein